MTRAPLTTFAWCQILGTNCSIPITEFNPDTTEDEKTKPLSSVISQVSFSIPTFGH